MDLLIIPISISVADELYSEVKCPYGLKSEAAICAEFASLCRKYTISGELKAFWCSIPNESPRGPRQRSILKALGLLSGAPDYVFIGPKTSLLLEFKSPIGRQSPRQKLVERHCKNIGVMYRIARSCDEGVQILLDSKILMNHKVGHKDEKREGSRCHSRNSGKSIQGEPRTQTPAARRKKPGGRRSSAEPRKKS